MAVTIAEFIGTLGLAVATGDFEKGEKALEGVKKAVEFLGIAEGVKMLGEMVEKTVDAAVSAKELAQQTGTTTTAIQELGYAASLTHVGTEEMNMAFRHLATGMEQAR